mmetsp:Transcript_128033/g.409380  ORF Transcript_128033/g.409380 Transcript_128033/m.409380 type:complete len:388 (+) Transcript_128033:125-1288(+)
MTRWSVAPAGGPPSDALWRRGARTREPSGRSREQREREAEEQGREQGRGEGTGGGATDDARAGAGAGGLCRDDVATSDPGALLVVHNNGAILHVHVRLLRGDLDGDAAANGARGSSRVDDVLPRIGGPVHEVVHVVVASDVRSDAAISDVHVDAASIGLVQHGIRGAILVGTHQGEGQKLSHRRGEGRKQIHRLVADRLRDLCTSFNNHGARVPRILREGFDVERGSSGLRLVLLQNRACDADAVDVVDNKRPALVVHLGLAGLDDDVLALPAAGRVDDGGPRILSSVVEVATSLGACHPGVDVHATRVVLAVAGAGARGVETRELVPQHCVAPGLPNEHTALDVKAAGVVRVLGEGRGEEAGSGLVQPCASHHHRQRQRLGKHHPF